MPGIQFNAATRMLLQDGFDVNVKMRFGKTLLAVAADYGQTEVLEYLISKGATVDVGTS